MWASLQKPQALQVLLPGLGDCKEASGIHEAQQGLSAPQASPPRAPGAFTWWGFQSLSKMITVSADWRFRPSPPARVLSRKMKYSEPGSLKVFSSMPRSSAFVVPARNEANRISGVTEGEIGGGKERHRGTCALENRDCTHM